MVFQSPRSGKFVSNLYFFKGVKNDRCKLFQSPRSGKFVSNNYFGTEKAAPMFCFNPLDRGNLYLIILTGLFKTWMDVSIP